LSLAGFWIYCALLMFPPSIRGRVGVNGRRACPHQCQVAHHSPLADYQSPPQRERPRPSASPLQRLNPSTLQRFDGFTLLKQRERASAFTLLELLIVVGIIAILLVLIAPAFTTIKGGTDVTSAAYTIKGALDTARTYAKANNTYTWVGFFEEDVSQSSMNPATAGTGRVVMSIVASNDGTMLYTGNLGTPVTLDPANSGALLQVGKLTKIDNVHLTTFAAPTVTPPPDGFDTRPAVGSAAAQIGDTAPPNPSLTFHYPVSSSSPQYTFVKVIQFSPRGEGVIDNSNYTFSNVSEIGLEPTHGATTPSPIPANVVAVQFTGLGGNVKIYRR
jgi:prepilin-type N-terminal cleavage/methylation domain-containing protein